MLERYPRRRRPQSQRGRVELNEFAIVPGQASGVPEQVSDETSEQIAPTPNKGEGAITICRSLPELGNLERNLAANVAVRDQLVCLRNLGQRKRGIQVGAQVTLVCELRDRRQDASVGRKLQCGCAD